MWRENQMMRSTALMCFQRTREPFDSVCSDDRTVASECTELESCPVCRSIVLSTDLWIRIGKPVRKYLGSIRTSRPGFFKHRLLEIPRVCLTYANTGTGSILPVRSVGICSQILLCYLFASQIFWCLALIWNLETRL